MSTVFTVETILADMPPRFEYADEFAKLFYALNRNMTDTVLLCLLIEHYSKSNTTPSYRELALKSEGAFAYRVVPKCLDRLAKAGFISRTDKQIEVQTDKLLSTLSNPQLEALTRINSQLFLWITDALFGDWQSAVILVSLIGRKGTDNWINSSYRSMLNHGSGALVSYGRLHEHTQQLKEIGLLRTDPMKRADDWFVESSTLIPLLTLTKERWLSDGAYSEPWAAGLRIALELGSIPSERAASDESILYTL